MMSKGLRNVSNVSFLAQSLVSYKFLSLYPETRVVLTLIKKMSLQQRPLMKIITNQYAELGNAVLTDSTPVLKAQSGITAIRGRETCKMQRNRKFSVILCLQEMSEAPRIQSYQHGC